MAKWILGATLALIWVSSANAELPSHSKVRAYGNQLVPGGQAAQIGSWIVDHKVHVTKASYSVLKDGSLVGGVTYALKGVDGKAAVVPAGAVIKGALVDVIMPITGSAAITAGLGVKAAGDVWAQQALSTLGGSIAVKTGVPSSVLPIKLTVDKNVSLALGGTGFVTAGKFNVLIEYYLSDAQ